MYLKLGDTNIKYSTSQNDFMIFSQIIESGMSYEKPILVRTSDELEIWFGRNFTEKYFFDQLLEAGVTLYLYRPILSEDNIYDSNYIDTSEFAINPKLYDKESELPIIGEEKTKYRVLDSDGLMKDETTGLLYSYYLWISGGYTRERDLPQNIDNNNTISLNNRDTLNIGYKGYEGPSYWYPIYRENETGEISEYPEILKDEDKKLLMSHLPNLGRVLNEYETLGFYLTITPEELDFTPSGDLGLDTKYIILQYLERTSGEYKKVLIWFEGENNILPTIPSTYYTEGNTRGISILGKTTEEVLEEFIRIVKTDYGYTIEKDNEDENTYKIYFPYTITVSYFYNIPGFSLSPSIGITHNILSSISKEDARIKFVSRTIGMDSLDGVDCNIRVQIEKLRGQDNYRITLRRYNYYEVFEGGLFTIGEDRIDAKITKESKLCKCSLVTSYRDSSGTERAYKLNPGEGERNSELPEGIWDLRRASQEDYTRDMYWKAVNAILGADDPVWMDYFLIPDMKKYNTSGPGKDYNYYPEYERFLTFAKNIGCQILIENTDNGWTYEEVDIEPSEPEKGVVYIVGDNKFMILGNDGKLVETIDPEIINREGNNFIFNYTEDLDNRLIWFYRGMLVNGNRRPGYYLHLQGLLSNIFSMSSNKILYQTPTTLPYEEEEIESKLEKYKSNYLVYNNQEYYYKKYQNGEDFNTSGWMRFCIGKVARELQKHKWEIVGQRNVGVMRERINQILNNISNSFSYINSLTLTELFIDYQNNTVELSVESRMSDLIDNNMTIDITLNYNTTNNE